MLRRILRKLQQWLSADEYDYSHTYYTNDILSHNTETSCAFLLWFAIFQEDKTIMIVSNKSTNAKEIISKIQYAYEELPDWLKPGIDDTSWNKHECKFDNNSRIVAQTTAPDSGRGFAISLLFCLDGESTCVTVRDKITGEIKSVTLKELYGSLSA